MFWIIYFITIPFCFLCVLSTCLNSDSDFAPVIPTIRNNYHETTIADIVISLVISAIPILNIIILVIVVLMLIITHVDWNKKIFK